jgi:hypothetical protein
MFAEFRVDGAAYSLFPSAGNARLQAVRSAMMQSKISSARRSASGKFGYSLLCKSSIINTLFRCVPVIRYGLHTTVRAAFRFSAELPFRRNA